jgi:hypothetical protein
MLNGQKVEIKTGGNFDPIPMDKYTVQIVDVNLVTQLKFQSTEEEEVLNYQFTVLDDKEMEVTSDGGEKATGTTRGRNLWKRCRLAMNNRSWLGKLAKAALGRDLTKEEVAGFDPESIIGKQVDVMVEQSASKDGQKIFNNIVAFNQTVKPLQPVDPKDVAKTGQVLEKKTVSATAPDADDEADALISETKKIETPDESPDEVADLEAKLAEAKRKKEAVAKK